jgi:flagellum-specific ATP synthase
MHNITDSEHQKTARRLKQLMSSYQRNRDLINVGAYNSGSDPLLDEAIIMHQEIEQFLQQSIHEKISIEQSLGELSSLFD